MKYESQNAGLLQLANVEQGMQIKIIEEAYSTYSAKTDKTYWNCKVELPDMTHRLASVGGITGDLFSNAWGSETSKWIGRVAEVSIRHSTNTGNNYIVLVPLLDADIADREDVEQERKEMAQKRKEDEEREKESPLNLEMPDDGDEIDPKDIPF